MRFSDFYIPEPNTGCWLWVGAKGAGEYGSYRQIGAHRFSYMAHIGPIPEGKIVCHRCNVPCCVNPDHLYAGTHRDNAMDAIANGYEPGGVPGVKPQRKPAPKRWGDIARLASSMGVTAANIKKWRQRGYVSYPWQIPLLHRAVAMGVPLDAADLDWRQPSPANQKEAA